MECDKFRGAFKDTLTGCVGAEEAEDEGIGEQVKEIAYEGGFGSLNSTKFAFSRMFKIYVHKNAGKHRRQHAIIEQECQQLIKLLPAKSQFKPFVVFEKKLATVLGKYLHNNCR